MRRFETRCGVYRDVGANGKVAVSLIRHCVQMIVPLEHNHSFLWALFPDADHDIAYYNQAFNCMHGGTASDN